MRGDRADPRRAPARARHARTGLRDAYEADSLADVYVKAMASHARCAGRQPRRRRGHLRACCWLAAREVLRVLQAVDADVAAPVVSSLLFILVFGLSLGGRIKQVDGFDYEVFIVPGLVTMAMVQAAYSNNSTSVFQARFDRYINDVLAAPMRAWEVNLGLSLGGVVRALLDRRRAARARAAGRPACRSASRSCSSLAVALALVLFSSLGRDRRDLRRDVGPPRASSTTS